MTAKRVDDNHARIVLALRKIGCSVTSLAAVGGGVPDLLVGLAGRNYLIEVKDGQKPPSRRKLTPDQQSWHETWGGQKELVNSVDEALDVVTRGKQV